MCPQSFHQMIARQRQEKDDLVDELDTEEADHFTDLLKVSCSRAGHVHGCLRESGNHTNGVFVWVKHVQSEMCSNGLT